MLTSARFALPVAASPVEQLLDRLALLLVERTEVGAAPARPSRRSSVELPASHAEMRGDQHVGRAAGG